MPSAEGWAKGRFDAMDSGWSVSYEVGKLGSSCRAGAGAGTQPNGGF